MYRLSVDMGGTFTDFSIVDDAGAVTVVKVPSSADTTSVMRQGLEVLSDRLELPLQDLLQRVGLLVHGTTVAVNALLQGRGPAMGLICTEGFRDSLEIRLGYRDKRYDFTWTPPPPLIPRYLRLPVRERIGKNGRIITPLHEEDVVRAVATFREHGIRTVVVSLLWSFLDPVHERQVHEIIKAQMPDAHVSLSSEVCPEIREYDRVSTTAVNAYIAEALSTHMDAVQHFFVGAGYKGEIRYLQSSGGIVGAEAIRSEAVSALNSGPAAGPSAARFFGNAFGYRDAITVDMGGTSFDTCVLPGGHPELRGVSEFGGYRVRCPTIDVQAIGAGGGSIAWVDRGLLRVGPQSAEANPGPACYDSGGVEPTVTDADVVLGYLNPEAQLGGVLKIKPELAREAITRRVAEPLNISAQEAARGIVDLVNRNMTEAIRRITLEKGYDPRDYALVVGGGAGPVHAGSLAQALGITRIIIPKVAAEFCSFGGLISDLRHDYRRSCASLLQALDLEWTRGLLQEMEREGREELKREGASADRITVTSVLDMRYKGQVYEIPIDVSDLTIGEDKRDEIDSRFHQAYHERYHFSEPGHIIEVINARVTVIAATPQISLRPVEEASSPLSKAQTGSRQILFTDSRDYVEAPVYSGPLLQAGHAIDGPAVVEEPHTAVVVAPGWRLRLGDVPAYEMTYTAEIQ